MIPLYLNFTYNSKICILVFFLSQSNQNMHTPFISPVITSKSIDDGMYVLTTTEFSRFMLPSLKADKSMMLSFINDFPVPKKIPVPKVR